MSKLTREVVYLNESDRPKKVEPLSFTEWCEMKSGYSVRRDADKIQKWTDRTINEASSEYATYLQEFSAEEKAVEYDRYLSSTGDIINCLDSPCQHKSITYLGTTDYHGDTFLVSRHDGAMQNIYFGKLNSGRY